MWCRINRPQLVEAAVSLPQTHGHKWGAKPPTCANRFEGGRRPKRPPSQSGRPILNPFRGAKKRPAILLSSTQRKYPDKLRGRFGSSAFETCSCSSFRRLVQLAPPAMRPWPFTIPQHAAEVAEKAMLQVRCPKCKYHFAVRQPQAMKKATTPKAMKTASAPKAMKKATAPKAMNKATVPKAMKKATAPKAMKKATPPEAMKTATAPKAMKKAIKQKAMKTAAAPRAMKKGIKQKRMQAEQEADEDASEDESERDLDTGKKIVYDPAAGAAIRAALADLLSPAP